MAFKFDQCLFEVLGKFAVAELSAVCDFINSKIDILDKELSKALAVTGSLNAQLSNMEKIVKTASTFLDDQIASSPLLSIARSLSPNCGPIADVFQGAVDAGNITATALADATYIARQISTRDGLIQTAKNEAEDAISALRDLCTIIQLTILEKSNQPGAANKLSDFIGNAVKKTTDFIK
jgi:hypothetical protein